MSRFSPQQSHLLRLSRMCMILFLSTLSFAGMNPFAVNLTGLFSRRPFFTWLCMGPALFLQAIQLYEAGIPYLPKRSWLAQCLVLGVSVLGLMLVPYRSETEFSTNLHLLSALLVLILVHVLLARLFLYRPDVRSLYLPFAVASLLFALTASSVNGISELVLGYGLTISLYWCAEPKRPAVND